MSWIIIVVDIIFLASLVFNLYWQSQIVVSAKYKISNAVMAVIFASWLFSVPGGSWPYVVMIAAFLTVTVMQGTGGVGSKRLVTSGFFSNVVSYKKVSHISLIPVEMPNMDPQVIAIFTINDRQNIQMTFKCPTTTLYNQLQKVISNKTQIEITQF